MQKPHIACIIDDDRTFTYLLSKQMKEFSFCETLFIFHNGMEALKYLKPIIELPDSLPDLILLDLNMPVMDGWQFLDEFITFEIDKKITIYIVSSSINLADHQLARHYQQVANFYVKPITKDHLSNMIRDMDNRR